jgi:nicotinamide-nucleotide amidase
MKAVILTIGDELLIGQVVNTNATWLGEQLCAAGVDLVRSTALGDDDAAIKDELGRAWSTAELVIVTGGLGPTHDDITRQSVAEYVGVPLDFDEAVFEQVKTRFARRGRSLPESNRTQAMVPRGFEVLANPVGTAPGLWYVTRNGNRTVRLAVLPGVPYEMKYLFEHEVLPRLRGLDGLQVIAHRTLLTVGIGESHLQERIGDLSGILSRELKLAYLPGTSGVRLRMSAYGSIWEDVQKKLDDFETYLRERISRYIFGVNEDTLEGAVGQLLQERGLTIALAESCTGGYVLNRLTNAAGSSAYVLGGVVAYSNDVKINQLGVNPAVLETEGAVSEAVARQMAAGARERMKADIGVSTTGIAGPSGGTPDKPVGLVWVGYADATGDAAFRLQLAEERLLNKELSSTALLNIIRRRLLGLDRET